MEVFGLEWVKVLVENLFFDVSHKIFGKCFVYRRRLVYHPFNIDGQFAKGTVSPVGVQDLHYLLCASICRDCAEDLSVLLESLVDYAYESAFNPLTLRH